jgi:crotonobetainyl-CoA:carnitine CoA-transferase CaiB-like acyl-CoA transferase
MRPLAGVSVLSLAQQLPGPYAGMILGDLGADVVMVERPPFGDPARAFPALFASVCRGQRSVSLDLKSLGGAAAFRALARRSDAVIEGMRPGAMERLGLGATDLTTDNPALIYVSLSAHGQSGQDSGRPNHDLGIQAASGLLSSPFRPVGGDGWAPALPVADLCAALFAVIAVLVGLRGRAAGRSSQVDVAMQDCLRSWVSPVLASLTSDAHSAASSPDPGYGAYTCSDGVQIALAIAHEDHFWATLCDLLDMPHRSGMTADERQRDRMALISEIAAAIRPRPGAYWQQRLVAAGIPHAQVLTAAQAVDAAAASDRGMAVRGLAGYVLAQPLVIDGQRPGPTRGPPALGEHTSQVLAEAGLDEAAITALLASGAAAAAPAS